MPQHGVPTAQNFTGVCSDLVLNSRVLRGALFLAVGLLGVCFPVVAQQAKHSGAKQHPAVTPLNAVSDVSLYRPNVLNASNSSLLLHNGPLRAWSDGAQLANQTALAQIGMAPLGLFPVAYLAPNYSGTPPVQNRSTASISRPRDVAADGKDLPPEVISSPLNQVYYTGEVGFMYGQWSGKGGGDYVGSYVWGQAGNDKFQITAGASFDNWSGSSSKIRTYQFSR